MGEVKFIGNFPGTGGGWTDWEPSIGFLERMGSRYSCPVALNWDRGYWDPSGGWPPWFSKAEIIAPALG